MRLHELRSNPDKNNDRGRGHKAALAYINKIDDGSIVLGVSMTDIPKLGVNPSTVYETPVAICFYPLDYYTSIQQRGDALPFQNGAKYIQVFSVTGNVVYINDMSEREFRKYIDVLMDQADEVSGLLFGRAGYAVEMIKRAVRDAPTHARADSPGGRLWYVFYSLCSFKSTSTPSGTPRSAVVWNKLLRLLGIQAIIDDGAGILHPNEPYQGMVFDPSVVKSLKTIPNDTVPEDGTGQVFVQNFKPTVENIEAGAEHFMSPNMFDSVYAKKFATRAGKAIIDDASHQFIHSLSLATLDWVYSLYRNPRLDGLIKARTLARQWTALRAGKFMEVLNAYSRHKGSANPTEAQRLDILINVVKTGTEKLAHSLSQIPDDIGFVKPYRDKIAEIQQSLHNNKLL